MNNLATFANVLAHLDENYKLSLGHGKEHEEDLDNITNLVQALFAQEHPDIKDAVITSWGENNITYIDIRVALKPEWCKWSKDDHQVKTQLSIDLENPGSWYMMMVVDCKDGEIEDWGEVTCQAEELESEQFPVTYMLNKVREKYDARKAEYDKHIAEGMDPDDA
jgi:hypothetical protein